MKLSWKDFLILNWPYLVFIAYFILWGAFTIGFESGKRDIIRAAGKALTKEG